MPRPSAKWLKIFLKRQGVDKFGAEYEPCIRATRAEAPPGSRPAILRPQTLAREVHVLSQPELEATVLALFNRRLFELHEQRMLSLGPRPHPLAQHPIARGLALPSLRGTVKVAEDLGILARHATTSWKSDDGVTTIMPYPYVGDLLLYLTDNEGPYCVNWTVKTEFDEFERPTSRIRVSKDPQRVQTDAQNRQAIESEYYADGDIRTVRIAQEAIDRTLIGNLIRAFGWSARDSKLTPIQIRRLIDRYNDALYLKIPPIEVILSEMRKHRFQREQCICVFNQAVWEQRLRLDLFKPVLIDNPLLAENVDVFSHYSAWFKRAE